MANESGLVPAFVIVDSRNVRGMADRVGGMKRLPSVAGVIAALRPYGIEATTVAVGIARPDPSSSAAGQMRQALLDNDSYAARVESHPRGQVLPGKLVLRNGVMEEKITDVACATEVCRQAHRIVTGVATAQAIVVISEDIDISPAFRFAEELGVAVYAAAHDTVHSRPGGWLLLGEPAFVRMCGRPPGMPNIGADLRAEVARRIVTRVTTPNGVWTVLYEDRTRGRIVVRDAQGVTGVVDPAAVGSVRPRQLINRPLTAVGVSFGGPRSNDFPQLILSPTSRSVTGQCETAEVEARRDPTRVVVRFTSGASAGSRREVQTGIAVPGVGDVVLVHVESAAPTRRSRVRLVGTLTPAPAIVEGHRDEPKIYTVVGETPLGDAVALDQAGNKDIVKLPRGVTPKPGERFAAVIIDRVRSRSSGGPTLIAQAISTKLP